MKALAGTLLLLTGCGPAAKPATAPHDPAFVPPGAVQASAAPGDSSSAAPSAAPRDARCPADDGASPSCARLPGAACLGASLARRACETVGPLLLPDVAERWITCLAGPGAPGGTPAPDAECDSSRILSCGFRAAESACVDGSFHDWCGQLSEDCADVAPEITAQRCEQLLGAFRPADRPKMIDCLSQGCGTGSFGVCLP